MILKNKAKLQICLCPLEDIPNKGSRAYVLDTENKPLNLMAIRKQNQVFVYENSCPHIGTPLDFIPGKFLDKKKKYILCSSHGALFRINDGYCIAGPCEGKSLKMVASTIKDKHIYIFV